MMNWFKKFTDNSRRQSLNGNVTNGVVNFGDNAVIYNQGGISPELYEKAVNELRQTSIKVAHYETLFRTFLLIIGKANTPPEKIEAVFLQMALDFRDTANTLESVENIAHREHDEKLVLLSLKTSAYLFKGKYAKVEDSLLAIVDYVTPKNARLAYLTATVEANNALASLHKLLLQRAEAAAYSYQVAAITSIEKGYQETALRYLEKAAEEFEEQGDYRVAIVFYQRLVALAETLFKTNTAQLAFYFNHLAMLHHKQGNYSEAEPLYQRSLAMREKTLGENHPDVASSLNNLAGLYDVQGNYTAAEPLYNRSLAIAEKFLGENHPNVATALNNLAGLYESQEKNTKAEHLIKRSLDIREKTLGKNYPDVADSLNSLAGLYDSQGKYATAEPLYLRSLAIREKTLGENHPDVATSLNNLAFLYEHQGKHAEAETLYLRSLVIKEKALGKEHPSTKVTRENLEFLQAAKKEP